MSNVGFCLEKTTIMYIIFAKQNYIINSKIMNVNVSAGCFLCTSAPLFSRERARPHRKALPLCVLRETENGESQRSAMYNRQARLSEGT